MTARNVEARIIKLEVARRRPDEILLIWREPDQAVALAISSAKFGPGDKVICAEWFGEDPMPQPKWHSERLSTALGPREYKFIRQTLERLIAACKVAGQCDLVEPRFLPQNRHSQIVEMTDNELLYAALGVKT